MKTVSAQEIKKKGITAVDKALKEGPVCITRDNKPCYVVLSEKQYSKLVRAEGAKSVKPGRVKTTAEIKKSLEEAESDR